MRFIAMLLLCCGASGAQSADPISRAMAAEMERAKTGLRLNQEKPPYYIEYSITDMVQYEAAAMFGALASDQRAHTRILHVLVRVGTYSQDSISGQNDSVLDLVSVDDNVDAIREKIWLASDAAYKAALQQLTAKEAALKQFESEKTANDFAHAPVVKFVGPPAKIEIDTNAWKRNLESVSALYRSDPKLQSFILQLRATATNRYFLNSEGSETRTGNVIYTYGIEGSTQADDGMRVERSQSKVVMSAAELPPLETLKAEAKTVMGTLAALRSAPMVEEQYRGPVLASPDAAGDIFVALIGENLLGRRPKPGDTSRVTGAFANAYKSRVLPDFVSIVDDPTRPKAAGTSLAGSYDVDDEAVKAQAVPLVQKGELTNYLMSRRPIQDFPNSNGHGRGASNSAAQPSLGNLFITSSEPLDKDALKKKFLESCKARGLKYGYRVETVLQQRLTPRLLYRVYVDDGHEELVRGAVFNQLDTRTMRSDVAALGNDVSVFNFLGPTPHSVVIPSVLFSELEIKRSNIGKEKLPAYSAPALAAQ
jgi:predicted Zn-dependent protease